MPRHQYHSNFKLPRHTKSFQLHPYNMTSVSTREMLYKEHHSFTHPLDPRLSMLYALDTRPRALVNLRLNPFFTTSNLHAFAHFLISHLLFILHTRFCAVENQISAFYPVTFLCLIFKVFLLDLIQVKFWLFLSRSKMDWNTNYLWVSLICLTSITFNSNIVKDLTLDELNFILFALNPCLTIL